MSLYSKRNYYLLVFSIIGLIIFFTVFKFISAIVESKSVVFHAPEKYLNLLKDEIKSEIVPVATYESEARNPIATMDYNNNMYRLIIYEINAEEYFTFDKINVKMHVPHRLKSGNVYNVINQGYFDLKYLSGKPNKVKNLSLIYEGDNLYKLEQNDSTQLYYLEYSSLGIINNDEKYLDMYFELGDNKKVVPINIVFLKRAGLSYILLLTVNNPNYPLSKELLISLIK